MTTINIAKESVPQSYAGQGTVGLTEVALSPVNLPLLKHVVIRANSANGNWIKVGPRGQANNGFPLLAGERTPPIYVDETNKVGVIAGGSNQNYSWVAT